VAKSFSLKFEMTKLRALYRAEIVGPGVAARKLAHETVVAIEDDLLSSRRPLAASLGTLAELQRRFGLGMPALRQAIAILEARGLVEVRRGIKGGLFVSQPAIQDVARALLQFLALRRARVRCVQEARFIVLEILVEVLLDGGGPLPSPPAPGSEPRFPVWLASLTGNEGLRFLAELIEEIHAHCRLSHAQPTHDSHAMAAATCEQALCAAISAGNMAAAAALRRELCAIGCFPDLDAPISLAAVTNLSFSLNPNKYAGRVAALLMDELATCEGTGAPRWLGSEREISERYGFDTGIVRQALRMLEDLDLITAQRGRHGGVFGIPPTYSALVRYIGTCLAARNLSFEDNAAVANFLAIQSATLAAQRTASGEPALQPDSESHSELGSRPPWLDVIATENLLLELSGNMILPVLVRGFALHALSTESPHRRDEASPEIMARVGHHNEQLLDAIRNGAVSRALSLARGKDAIMKSLET
jgi:DNA-binding FadR family transcriptional regulator